MAARAGETGKQEAGQDIQRPKEMVSRSKARTRGANQRWKHHSTGHAERNEGEKVALQARQALYRRSSELTIPLGSVEQHTMLSPRMEKCISTEQGHRQPNCPSQRIGTLPLDGLVAFSRPKRGAHSYLDSSLQCSAASEGPEARVQGDLLAGENQVS
jgi:hypothetical protein